MNTDGGRFDFDDGGTYIGNWYQGSAHGLGLATGPNGVGEYSGEWNLGFETCGVYLWPNGNMYAGTWIKGKRHGDGVQVRGKWIYQGEFNAGSFGQYGVKTSINSQAKYEGSWSLNRFEGFGIETCADGSIYAGAWSKGFRHGLGVRKSFISYKANSFSDNSVANLSPTKCSNEDVLCTSSGVSCGPCSTFPTTSSDENKKIPSTSQSPVTSEKRHSSTANLPSNETTSVSRKAVIGRAIMRRLKKQHSAIELGRSTTTQPTTVNGTAVSSTPKTSPPRVKQPMTSGETSQQQSSGGCINSSGGEKTDHPEVEKDKVISVVEIYAGEWFQDQRSGYGIAERSNGFVYIGEWTRNQKHGYGIIINPNGTRDEGQFQANNLVNKVNRKSKLHLVRQTKLKECVEDALFRAEAAAKQAKLVASEEAKERALKARKSAELAMSIIQKALHLSDKARELAFQLDPQFHQPGVEWRKKCQFEINTTDDTNESKPSTLCLSSLNLNISSDTSPTTSSVFHSQSNVSSRLNDEISHQVREQGYQERRQVTSSSARSSYSTQSLKYHQNYRHPQIRRKFFRKFLSRDSTPNSVDPLDESSTDAFERFANFNKPNVYRFIKPTADDVAVVSPLVTSSELIRPFSAPHKTFMNELKVESYSPSDRTISPLKEVSNEDMEQKGTPTERNVDTFSKQMSLSAGDLVGLCKASIEPSLSNLGSLSSYRQEVKQLSPYLKSTNPCRSTSERRIPVSINTDDAKISSTYLTAVPGTTSSNSMESVPRNDASNETVDIVKIEITDQPVSQLQPSSARQEATESHFVRKCRSPQIVQSKRIGAGYLKNTQHPPKLGMNSTQDSGYLSMDPSESRSFSIQTLNRSMSCQAPDAIVESDDTDEHQMLSKNIRSKVEPANLPVNIPGYKLSVQTMPMSDPTKFNRLTPVKSPYESSTFSLSLSPKAKKLKVQTEEIPFKPVARRQVITARRKFSNSPRRCYKSDGSLLYGVSQRPESYSSQRYWVPDDASLYPTEHYEQDDFRLRQLKPQMDFAGQYSSPSRNTKFFHPYIADTGGGVFAGGSTQDVESVSEKSEFSSATVRSAPHFQSMHTDFQLNELGRLKSREWPMDMRKAYCTQQSKLGHWDYSAPYDCIQHQLPAFYAGDDGTGPVLYEQSLIQGDRHSLDRHVSQISNQAFLQNQRTMSDRFTRAHTKPFTAYNSSCFHGWCQIPRNRRLQYIPNRVHSAYEDFGIFDRDRSMPTVYMKQQKQQQVHQTGIKENTVTVNPQIIHLRRSSINSRRYISKIDTDKSSHQTDHSMHSFHALRHDKYSQPTTSSPMTPSMYSVCTSAVCPSKYVSTPLTSASALWSQVKNPFCMNKTLHTGSWHEFPKRILRSTYPYCITHSSNFQQFHRQQKTPQQEQFMSKYSTFPLKVNQTMNRNEVKYSTLPPDNSVFLRRPPTETGFKKLFTHDNIRQDNIDLEGDEKWLRNTVPSDVINAYPSRQDHFDGGVDYDEDDDEEEDDVDELKVCEETETVNQHPRRISWPQTLYEFIPETHSDDHTNSSQTMTNNGVKPSVTDPLQAPSDTSGNSAIPVTATPTTPVKTNGQNYFAYYNPWYSLTLMNTIILTLVLVISIVNWLWREEKQKKAESSP
ncbi:unnamed protein product [Trichobilharzia szidati]|nr:unnamed protein product [Trichobilharzia szidati]